MKRFALAVLVAATLAAPPAQAGATQERIVEELKDQGFTRIQIQRTWLGRTRIYATRPDARREIVFNPSTGVILRDFWRVSDDDDDDRTSIVDSSDDYDDDDDDRRTDDDDDDDDDRDNSGSGSSDDDDDDDDDDDGDDNSGSGSSGGGDDDDDDDDD